MELLAFIAFVFAGWVLFRWMMRERPASSIEPSANEPARHSDPVIARIQGDGAFALDVVGESNYQDEIDRIVGGKTTDGHRHQCEALLICEDTNPYDSNAVKVAIDGEVVGYLSRPHARQHRQRMEEAGVPGATGLCKALIVGGWKRGRVDEGSYGVKLDIPTTGAD